MKPAPSESIDFSPAHCRQAQAHMDVSPAPWAFNRLMKRIEQASEKLWLRWHQQAIWWVTIESTMPQVKLWHRHKGLFRRWSGAHAQLLMTQCSLTPLLGRRKRCALQQHQVAHVLMAAAASELMLKRLSKIRQGVSPPS